MSTIFALSSGSLPSAIAIFRISGSKSLNVLRELSGIETWKPRMMRFARIHNQHGLIDEAMAVYMPGPRTFTGEDTAEIYIHGSIAVARQLASTLSVMDGVRESKRGEFTRRAFYNGKMDLNGAKAIDRLIRSRTVKESRSAFGQMRGGSKALEIKKKLMDVLSRLFIIIDFGEHVQMNLDEVRTTLKVIDNELKLLMAAWNGAHRMQRGLRIVLYGRPNSGKSSIMNRLANDDIAIVSPIAGTTRDSIDVSIEIGGVVCRLTDTAGIRGATCDEIEVEGMQRARKKIAEADIVLIVIDPETSDKELEELKASVKESANPEARVIIVHSKSDLRCDNPASGDNVVATSIKTDDGVNLLRVKLEKLVEDLCPEVTYLLDGDILSRCSDQCRQAIECEDAAIMCTKVESIIENIAQLTSNVVTEDVLDNIFDKFCIGK